MSRLPLWDLGRDVSVAVGAYIGIARDQFWSWLANDGYSLRLAEAVKRFEAADRLAEKEEEEVSEAPDNLWAAEARAQASVEMLQAAAECRCPSCLDVLEAEQESSPAADEDTASAGSPSFSGLSGGADWARGSSRAATAAGEPISVAARQRTEEAGAPRPPVGAPAIPNAERVGTLWEHFPRVHTEGGIACRCNKRFWASVDWSRHALAALDEAVNK